MVWALLALLGIPIWFIALVLIAAFRNRRKVRSDPSVFTFKARKDDGWRRGKVHARWVSDVLITHSGIALIRMDAAKVDAVTIRGPIEPPPKGLGESASEVCVAYAEGSALSVAVSAENLDAMLGPMNDGSG